MTERMVPRDLEAPHHPDGGGPAFVTTTGPARPLPLSAGEGISRGDLGPIKAIAQDLDVREYRARTAISVALSQLEEREFPAELTAADFRRQAACLRGAARNINEALVELASIAGEYDGQARGL